MQTEVAEQKQVYFKVSVYTKGIKKRCRKESSEFLRLGKLPTNYTPEQLLEFKAKAKQVLDANMKSFRTASLDLKWSEYDGVFESFIMFDERHQSHNLMN